ncbi:MAG: hypothetical protein ACTSYD_01365 [Candidatus Heimdallarchaeaceae archaeon]
MKKDSQEKSYEEVLSCPECGSSEVAYTVSDIVCKNCGTCIDQIYVATHFIDRAEGTRRGSPESRRGKTTMFNHKDIRPGEKRAQFQRLYRTENGTYDAIEEHRSRFILIFNALGLSEKDKNHLLYQIKKKYHELKRKGKKVTNIFLIAAALTIRYIKRIKRPESLGDVVKIFKQHNCKLSAKAVRDYIIENNMTYQTSKPIEWIEHHMAKIRNDPNIRSKLAQMQKEQIEFDVLLMKIERIAMKLAKIRTNGRKASVLSASCIFLAGELIGHTITGENLFTKEDIARTCNVPTTTIRHHYNYLKSLISK